MNQPAPESVDRSQKHSGFYGLMQELERHNVPQNFCKDLGSGRELCGDNLNFGANWRDGICGGNFTVTSGSYKLEIHYPVLRSPEYSLNGKKIDPMENEGVAEQINAFLGKITAALKVLRPGSDKRPEPRSHQELEQNIANRHAAEREALTHLRAAEAARVRAVLLQF